MRYSFIVLLVAFAFRSLNGTTIEQNFGKVNITASASDGFFCEEVSFLTPFQTGSKIRVFPTLSYEINPEIANEAFVVVLTSANYSAFNACIVEPSQPTGKATLNWFAFSDKALPQGMQAGSVSYNMFTSGIFCNVVNFASSFSSPPKILVSVHRNGNIRRKDAMLLWVEDVTRTRFRVCLREMINFSGVHKNLQVEWVALSNTSSANMTDLDSIVFPNKGQPSLENNYAYCQIQNFTQRFFKPPIVILTANRRQNGNSSISYQSIVTWVKNVDRTTFEVCLKDLPGINGQHEPITVDYAVIGDLDPCIGVTCDYFAVCRVFGPYDARCVCVENCPSTEQNLCASNGRSFDNMCLFQLEICQTKDNYTYYHHGSCRGFPMTRGRGHVNQVPRWSDAHCQSVRFEPLTFYPDKPVHVQVSVSHVNSSSQVHDAAVSWVEDVSDNSFTFCVMESGRNEGPRQGFATIEWIAYQGAPQGGASGVVSIPEWWTGTKCQTVDISALGFGSTPTVLATAEHRRRSVQHDAASVWLEDISRTSFRVCLRELQNFDGAHQDIHVNWLAFEVLERPLFIEHGSNDVAQTSQNPLASLNYAQCENVSLRYNYRNPPTVLVAAKHSSSGRNLDPQYNGITAWIESITTSQFKMCFKELFANGRLDPVTLNYVVLRDICDPGWVYYRRFCYKRADSCLSWTNASTTCLAASSNLVGIDSAEEDVFVQHLHRDKPSWIGLNDYANEGVYLWTDGGPVSYTNWGPGITAPPTDDDADCVDSSGRDHKYHWKVSSCDNCQNYTCKKDHDECTRYTHECHPKAHCLNTVGSYTCQCHNGYTGNGMSCTDVDECAENTAYECHANADCTNTIGSYTCHCRTGYTGNGRTCNDIDECSQSISPCDPNANCVNSVGSFTCQCRSGYTKSGEKCYADCGNPGNPRNGYRSGSSYSYGAWVSFRCYNYNYRLRGASSAWCQANGQWSNPTPSCYYNYYG